VKGYLAVLAIAENPASKSILNAGRAAAFASLSVTPSKTLASSRFEFSTFSTSGADPEDIRIVEDKVAGRISIDIGPKVALLNGSTGTVDLSGFSENLVGITFAAETNQLQIKTDLLNSSFVYHAWFENHLVISNSSLLIAKITGANLDPTSAIEFLSTGSIYGNRSLYEGIRTFLPSRKYTWRSGRAFESERIWKPEEIAFNTGDIDEAADRIIKEMDEEFGLLARSNKKLIVDLTGGYDSRVNFGFALRNSKSFETIVAGASDSPDVRISRKISAFFGIKNRWIGTGQEADDQLTELMRASGTLTDFEYDILEYARIFKVQNGYDHRNEVSIHGSIADITRNYFLLPQFYAGSPEGQLQIGNLVGKKFTQYGPVMKYLSREPVPDWSRHMQGIIGEYDVPSLPAFARLDIIYLRIRMQFWQGRINSSTNHLHACMSPWANSRILETILSIKWEQKKNAMLSRKLIARIHPKLADFPIDGGKIAGVSMRNNIQRLPEWTASIMGKVSGKIFRTGKKAGGNANVEFYRSQLASNRKFFEPLLNKEGIQALLSETESVQLLVGPVTGRLTTLLAAGNMLKN
jgi:hypothetical protein